MSILQHNEFSRGTLFIAAAAKAIPRKGRSLQINALQNGTAIDRAFLASTTNRLAGARDIIGVGHPLHDEFLSAAKKISPNTVYGLKQVPSEAERTILLQFRFRALENYALDTDWTEPADPKREAMAALRSINHITIEDVGLAFDAVAVNAARLGPRNKAMHQAWSRNVCGLRNTFSNMDFKPTDAFVRRFAPLIATGSALDAVTAVLEQAFEFERLIEYLSESLYMIKAIRGDMATKGLWYSDLSPIMTDLAISSDNSLREGDFAHNGRAAFDAINGKRLARHGFVAPEGERWHRILGYSALEYVLHYLISTMNRFKRLGIQPQQGHWEEGSALLRVALNILAHVDPDEAQAELKARLTHSKNANPRFDLQRQIPRARFDMLSESDTMLDRQLEDSWWGGSYVMRFANEHRRLCKRGLLEQDMNPFARAFYFPRGFSEPFETSGLRLKWERASTTLRQIDGRYVSKANGGTNPIGKKEISEALLRAAAQIEAPNPIGICRSLALAKDALTVCTKGSNKSIKMRNKCKERTSQTLKRKDFISTVSRESSIT